MALSQEDYMTAYVGDDKQMWKPMPGYFTPGVPLYTEEGGEILKGKRDLTAAKRLLAESGYAGEAVVSMAAQDVAVTKAFGDVTADLLTRLGVKVDYVAVDWGTVVSRRTQKAPPDKGGWNLFGAYFYGVDCADPTCKILRAHGDKAFFGWPNIPVLEAEIASWYDARNFEEEKAAARRINNVALENAVYAPLGQFLQYQAWRKNVSGVLPGPLPFFWGVTKTA